MLHENKSGNNDAGRGAAVPAELAYYPQRMMIKNGLKMAEECRQKSRQNKD